MHHEENYHTTFEKFFVSNVQYEKPSWTMRLKALGRLLYSFEARCSLRALLQEFKPAVAHVNNIAHQLSPSILHELKRAKVPIIMTLHDFKLVCPSYKLLAKGQPCERCSGGRYYRAIRQRCHNDSFVATTAVAAEMTLHHHLLHSYRSVDLFIASSRFLKSKIDAMGFQGRIVCLPNFVHLEDYPPTYGWKERCIVYFGRLSEEKGLRILCDAMKGLKLTLHIVGEGPERTELEHRVKAQSITNIVFWGNQRGKSLQDLIAKSMFAVLPAIWYENNPRSVIEAFALGKPVIGANIGGIPELIKHNITGLLFTPGSSEDLREAIEWLANAPDAVVRMGRQARAFVEKELNSEQHYSRLLQIYDGVLTKSIHDDVI
jgi:glycosyltransferase involved in cell wall biosynthesis